MNSNYVVTFKVTNPLSEMETKGDLIIRINNGYYSTNTLRRYEYDDLIRLYNHYCPQVLNNGGHITFDPTRDIGEYVQTFSGDIIKVTHNNFEQLNHTGYDRLKIEVI